MGMVCEGCGSQMCVGCGPRRRPEPICFCGIAESFPGPHHIPRCHQYRPEEKFDRTAQLLWMHGEEE